MLAKDIRSQSQRATTSAHDPLRFIMPTFRSWFLALETGVVEVSLIRCYTADVRALTKRASTTKSFPWSTALNKMQTPLDCDVLVRNRVNHHRAVVINTYRTYQMSTMFISSIISGVSGYS